MLVDRPDGGDRVANATRKVARVATPRNLDRDLPGRRVAHGFNIGLTPVLFAAIGYGIDRVAGTAPVFLLGLTVLSIVGLLVSNYYKFKAAFDAEAAAAPGRSGSRRR